MKKNILLICAFTLATVSCSGDYEDASSRHTYGENESVGLNTSVGTLCRQSIEFAAANLQTASISLTEYASVFKSEFGMSVDEVIAAVGDESIKFRPIYTSSGLWLAEPFNNQTGWYFNLAGKVCTQENSRLSVCLNTKDKALDVIPSAGLPLGSQGEVNVGFAKRSTEYGTYEKYVRFQIPVSVVDKSVILGTLPMAEGDYAGYEFFFKDNYDEQFLACMGMTAQETLNGLENGTVGFAITDADGNNKPGDYTADSSDGYYGYWLDAKCNICAWGDGAAVYTDAELNECAIYFGRYPGFDGPDMTVYSKLYLLSNPEKCIRFIFTLQF